jgi:hypothetical protein
MTNPFIPGRGSKLPFFVVSGWMIKVEMTGNQFPLEADVKAPTWPAN